MEPLILILILAAFGEVVIEVLKPLLEPAFARLPLPEDINPYLYLSCAFGLLLSFTYTVNILAAIGVTEPNATAHYIGVIATGMILGRGANFVHNVISRLAVTQ